MHGHGGSAKKVASKHNAFKSFLNLHYRAALRLTEILLCTDKVYKFCKYENFMRIVKAQVHANQKCFQPSFCGMRKDGEAAQEGLLITNLP